MKIKYSEKYKCSKINDVEPSQHCVRSVNSDMSFPREHLIADNTYFVLCVRDHTIY